MKISECKINDMNHLTHGNKLVVVQIGWELFCLDHLRTIKNPDEISQLIKKYNLKLLKE